MSTTKFNMTKDIAGYNGFGVVTSTVKNGTFLAQDTPETLITIPSDYDNYIVVFSYSPGSNVFVDMDTTASAFTSPPASVTSELLPQARQVKKGTVISVMTPDTAGAYVQASVYVVQPFGN